MFEIHTFATFYSNITQPAFLKCKMHLQFGDDLRTVHNAQLVYSNRQDIALTLLTGFKIWLGRYLYELNHTAETKEMTEEQCHRPSDRDAEARERGLQVG